MRYDAAVLYDEVDVDVDVRRWVENKLVEKMENQWQLKLFIMGRVGESEGGEIEALAREIAQSDTLLLCLSQHVLELPIIRDQFRIALSGSRPHHKYIFVTFETSRESHKFRNVLKSYVPRDCENVIKQLIFESPAIRLHFDPRAEDIFWRHFQQNFGSTRWRCCVGSGRSATSTSLPEYSYTELLKRERNDELDG